MQTLNGFIKLHRSLLSWEWYENSVVKCVFLHLLLLASFKESKWQGETIEIGQVIVSVDSLSKKLGFTTQQIRTALNKLKSTNEITIKTTNKYTLITLSNWGKYQSYDETLTNEITSIATNEQQTNNKPITNEQQHRKNVKELKNVNKDKNIDTLFETFWKAYPNKKAKANALKAFNKINPNSNLFDLILKAIENQKKTESWIKEDGKYIPHPTTWLNAKRWEDEVPAVQTKPAKPKDDYNDIFFKKMMEG